MRCKVPIDFEYALVWLTAHPDIWVEPMEGIIPAQSSVEVAVHYKPSEMSTARAQAGPTRTHAPMHACTARGLVHPLHRCGRLDRALPRRLPPRPLLHH